jgi:hypothetical protein
MSVRLVFQDEKKNPLHDENLTYKGSIPIPAEGDTVLLPGGQQVKVKSRHFVYQNPKPRQADVQITFVCTRDEKPSPRGGRIPISGH